MTVQLFLERETARDLYWSIPIDAGVLVESLRQKLIAATEAVDDIDFGEDQPTLMQDKARELVDRAAARLDDAHDALDTLIKLADMNTCELRAELDRVLFQ